MKASIALLAALLLSSPVGAQDENALKLADRDAQASLNIVNQARQEYLHAVQRAGVDSPDARAAKIHLDQSRDVWHQKLTVKHQRRLDARGEMTRQRAERREYHGR